MFLMEIRDGDQISSDLDFTTETAKALLDNVATHPGCEVTWDTMGLLFVTHHESGFSMRLKGHRPCEQTFLTVFAYAYNASKENSQPGEAVNLTVVVARLFAYYGTGNPSSYGPLLQGRSHEQLSELIWRVTTLEWDFGLALEEMDRN